MLELSASQARRIAIHTQLHAPGAIPGDYRGLVAGLNVIQIDSVNYFSRAHYMPAYSRWGGQASESAFDALAFDDPHAHETKLVEYWAHEACLLPAADLPLFQWRMDEFRQRKNTRNAWARENTRLLRNLKAELADRGPLRADELSHGQHEHFDYWWTKRSAAKQGLEVLLDWGEVTTAGRDKFRRRFQLTEQVISPAALEANRNPQQAQLELTNRAIQALGIGTAADIADYFRMRTAEVRPALTQLHEQGVITPARVGADTYFVSSPALRWADTPLSGERATLLSPFDPLVWYRPRTERLFDFHYRIEIYTPAAKRKYGYYCLPILIGEHLVGRLDLKRDRKANTLHVKAAWQEYDLNLGQRELIWQALREAAGWQSLEHIKIDPVGNLAPHLNSKTKPV